ncbi:PBECR2 nuclease fold domain-containing protein [Campylobacter upsaliensis]|uniref:putative barnase/colicin E5 family endoribonuclease n=6 Tax=Campylobacter upsaliensis TaxID=28080 RepID=UPI0022EB33BE|nr:PBECR2 nuclease fold domain-containing protein [Campylobacter upsaliensis]
MDDPSQAEPHLTKLNTSTLGVSRAGVVSESITQPLFKSKEAREFLELVEGFHKLYKNDASIAKNLVQGTASQLSTSIATSAEGAIKQKVVKGGFDPIFRLLPDGILFGLFSKQIQGGALRYHLRKALSRSLNYDDFKLKLERELKRTNFNSNTSRLIEKFMQNLEDFNAEKEAKLARIREEEELQRAEELKRLNEIKAAQENAYHTQEANLGQDILETELKEDFGVNFEGFKGKEAINKLLEEKRGQVKGAFYKEGLGEIDLVWGDKNYGLEHILNKHGGEFEDIAAELSEAMEKGVLKKQNEVRSRIEFKDFAIGLSGEFKGEKRAFIITAFKRNGKSSTLSPKQDFTDKSDNVLSNQEDIIPQNSEKLPFEMQVLDEDKLSGDEVRLLANKIGEKSTMAYFKDYLLKMDKNFHARAKDIIREYYKIEPFRKELENQWENVKEAYKNGEMSLKEFKFLSRYKDEKSFLNQVAGVLWLQNDELVKNRGYTINKYGLTEQGKGDNYYQNLALEYGKAQTALKKWFYYIQKANKQAQRFFNKKELEDLRANEKAQKLEAKGSEDIIFTDKKGKEHTLTKETQKAWLEAFGLKSLEEAYIPNFKAEVKEAINRVLGGEEIKLTKGSFEKLLKRDREEFLPYIKDTLEKANAVIKQVDGALIFAKDYRNERLGKFFASVSRNDEGEWIITSNAPKNLNNLKNKLNEGGELLYSDLPELTIIAKPDLDANTLNSEANLKDIIPQKANLEAVNKQKDKEFLEAYEKADFKGKVELAKQDINEEIKFLEKQKEEFERITQQKDYNDIELEQARKILENAKEEVEGHYRIKYMQNGKEMRAYISKTDYFNQGKILSKDEILHKIIQKTIYKDKIENIKKTSDKLKKQIKIIDEYLKEYGDNEAGAISDDIIEKFKYYNFAKDTGKGEIIIGERQKGLYEQAQKVLNSRFLKAKKRSAQSKKNYNITYDEARKLFYKGDMSEEQKELFQSVLPIAQKLNVRIRTAIREPYEDMIKDTTNIAGMYRYELNTATLKKGGNRTDTQRAETLLHELIHSVTSRAMSLYKTPLRDKMLSKTQIKAIDEIDQIYKKLYKFKKTFKLQDENGADLYGIKNSHEMLAELANPMFSSKLKEIGLYEKLVNNIMKIILSVRDFIRLRSDKNVYEKLKQCLKDIIENYKDDFTQEYEKQNIRDFTLTSQTQKEQIYTQRQELKSTLKAKINQAITNENTGEKAILTNKGISKMLSDKAISKSVDNGFSREKHLRAVGVVDELFKRAKRAFSKRDEKDKNLSIYRYNAPFKNANALMTLKEYKQNGKRIYSLELENLEAAKFNPSGKDLAEQLSKSKDADTTTFHTPIDNPDESIAQKSDNIYHSNPHLGAGLVGGVLNGVEQDENGNLSFDPVKFAMGFLGGSGGSFALKKGFQILEKNPELKEKIINELADTLAQGFEKAREKYPLLSLLEPRYIVKNEKGRKIQAKTMLKELEREQKGAL